MKRIGTIKQTIVGLANIFGDDWLGEELLELVGRKGRPRRDAMIIAIKQGYAILAAGSTRPQFASWKTPRLLMRAAAPTTRAPASLKWTPHVMLVGPGAEEFAKSQGIELVSPFYFYDEHGWEYSKKANIASLVTLPSTLLQPTGLLIFREIMVSTSLRYVSEGDNKCGCQS